MKKKQYISVTNLARYWSNEEEFEIFLQKKPNQTAIKVGNKFHNNKNLSSTPILIKLLITGAIIYAIYFIINNSNIFTMVNI